MDTLLRHVYPKFDAPGQKITVRRGCYTLDVRGMMNVSYQNFPMSRALTMSQTMTYLGRTRAQVEGGPSDFDGISRLFLTPDGLINFSTVATHIKSHGGQQNQAWSAYVANVERWKWSDNHVALLTNMLRYTMLRKFAESSENGSLDAVLPCYDDGHVRVNRDKILGYDIVPQGAMRWPGSIDDDDWPGFERAVEYAPAVVTEMIDCRSMSAKQVQFVLMMTGKWRRQSAYMLDFDTPRLSTGVMYRADHNVDMLSWLRAEQGQIQQPMPALLSSQEAWDALSAYVSQNRLFNQFSTALYLVTSLMCQMLPATAEGQIWLQRELEVKLPQFRSVRGRFPFFNEGDSALLNHRALQEWALINNSLERVALMGSIMAQGYQTGLAIRNIRLNIEVEPRDIYSSKLQFYKRENQFSAAVSEALRIPVPLAGMSDCYVFSDDLWEGRLSGMVVATETPGDTELPGYSSTVVDGYHVINVFTLPMAGVPTLLLPLDSFSGMSPFSLKGELDGSKLERTRHGWKATPYEAWHWSWAARLCGYDVDISTPYLLEGAARPYAPNESSWTWPLMVKQEAQGEKLTISAMRPRSNHFIELPLVQSKFFDGVVKYTFLPLHHAVTNGERHSTTLISEFGGMASTLATTSVKIDVPAGVTLLRGFIARGTEDFRFVNNVQGGLIPEAPEVIDVPVVAPG